MINFIGNLETILKMSGREDWEIMYSPKQDRYYIKLADDTVFISKVYDDKGKF